MKKIISSAFAVAFGLSIATSCIEEYNPQTSYVSEDQAADAPGSFQNFVNAITAPLVGEPNYTSLSDLVSYPSDFGYPGFFQQRDVMGQDLVPLGANNTFQTWYQCSVALGPQYAICQMPWTEYYNWIKNCNTVIGMAGENPSEEHRNGAGIAYAMRAMFYMDMARMFAQKTYALDKQAETVPIITEQTAPEAATNNPRATNEAMWAFILSDLDKAEQYIVGYTRKDISTPDLSVVYGLKARAYLTMENWPEAEKYAKLAQEGYTMLSESEYLDRENSFNNTNNNSWMLGLTFTSDDECINYNDGDSSWGSLMSIEMTVGNGYSGYAANYGCPTVIDRHLYETIPATDYRKQHFIDFSLDEMTDPNAVLEALSGYTDYPENVYNTGSACGFLGGLSLKFRPAGGDAGRDDYHIGFVQSVPLMRVEEMMLIEAEAAGMQEESRGIQLLTNFAKARDPQYVYGTHNEAYYNNSTSAFQNEVWWQRRVELWGEGFATFDIKRLNKGIIRSYANTNHIEKYRWNVQTPPEWMNLCIVQTETNYNTACTNNPTPQPLDSDSPEYVW